MTGVELSRYRDRIVHSIVFEQLTPAELDLIVPRCRLVEASPGQMILTEGKQGTGLYIVLEGEVEAFLPDEASDGLKRRSAIQLNVLGPGRCFGEYGLVDDSPSSASVRALVPTRLCWLPRDDFRSLTEQHDRLAKVIYSNLLRFLIRRLRVKDQELDVMLLIEDRAPPA
jgi:CRP-like cAMP-binding protein